MKGEVDDVCDAFSVGGVPTSTLCSEIQGITQHFYVPYLTYQITLVGNGAQ